MSNGIPSQVDRIVLYPPPVVFLSHPLRADTEEGFLRNVQRAKAWYRFFLTNYDIAIIADWLITFETTGDLPADRLRGQRSNAILLTRADELWVCGGEISSGMRSEMFIAHALSKPIRQFIDIGPCPPEQYNHTKHAVSHHRARVVDPTWRIAA